MDLSIVRFNKAIDSSMVALLEDGWDWPLADCETLASFVAESYRNSDICYWVFRGSQPVGVLEFSEYSEGGGLIDIGLFVHKDYRGLGVAEVLLHSSLDALGMLGLEPVATVHVDNGRSLALTRKATGLQGVKVFEVNRDRYAWVFDFSVESFVPKLAVKSIVDILVSDGFVLESLTV